MKFIYLEWIMKLPSWPKNTWILVISISSLIIVGLITLLIVVIFRRVYVSTPEINYPTLDKPLTEDVATTYAPLPTQKEDKRVNVLLLGHGGDGHDGGYLMDSIIVVSIDPVTKKAALISIPRDFWFPFPVDYNNQTNKKINEGYSIGVDNLRYPNLRPEFKGAPGGWNLMKYAASSLTGINVQNFLAIDFNNFQKAINLLQPLEINVPKEYTDNFYPIKGLENETCNKTLEEIEILKAKYSGFDLEKQFECRYEKLHFDKGTQNITGEQALKYVRSRHGDSDYGRSERQFAVLDGIKNKIVSAEVISKGGTLLDQLTKTLKSDLSVNKIKEIYKFLGNPSSYKVSYIRLSEDNVLIQGKGPQGQFMLAPKAGVGNFSEIKSFIAKNYE